MDDQETPIWVRITGVAGLAAMIAVGVLIVSRDTLRSTQPAPAPSTPDDEPTNEPDASSATPEPFSASELADLQACIAEDATLADEEPDARLRNLITFRRDSRSVLAAIDVVQIAADIEQLRGFRYTQPFDTRFMPAKKIGALAARSGSATKSDAMRFADIGLTQLGVLREDEHLRDVTSEVTSDQVAGFYRPGANTLVVPSPGNGRPLNPLDKAVLAHELEHALVDQRIRIRQSSLTDVQDSDASLAALTVVEGSATLTGYRWTQAGLDFFELLELSNDHPRAAGSEQLEATIPYFVMSQFTWPYFKGVLFVCRLYEVGGWRLVNRALRNPPTTTLEILEPELYLNGYEPPRAPKGSSPGPGWKLSFQTTFGAADWLWLLEAPGDDPALAFADARERAADWAGGEVHIWTKRNDSALVVLGKSRSDRDFCITTRLWSEVVYRSDAMHSAVSCRGRAIRLGVASSRRIAKRLVLPSSVRGLDL